MTAKDSRVILRPLEEGDINDEYISWFRDAKVTQFLDSSGFEIADSKAYLKTGKETKSYFMYAIVAADTNKHIGNLKIGPINWKHKYSDMITVIGDRNYWGQGLATQAIGLGIRLAFDLYGMRKLSAGLVDGNEGSLKSYTRAGFVIEGRLKAQFLFKGEPRDRIQISCFNPAYFPD